MSEIYSKYLSLNESKSVEGNKKNDKKNARKPLKEGANFGEGEKAIKKVARLLDKNGYYVDSYEVEYESSTDFDALEDGEYVAEEWVYIKLEEPIKTEEDFEKINSIIVNALKDYELINYDGVMYNSKVGDNTILFVLDNEIMYESKKNSSMKNKKKLSEKSKKKAIKEWRRNVSGYSEISDEEVKKYQSELDEIGDKLEKSGISVKKVGQVNVEEFEGTDDYFTEEAWGYIELSKPVKDEDEFEKICDIVEPYIDNRLSDVKDIGYVGSEDLYITFKVVDRFWDDEELEESSRKKSRFSKKRLSEKDSETFNKAFKDFEKLVREVAKSIGIDMYIDDIWTNSEYEGKVIVDFEGKAPSQKVEALRKSLEDDIRVEKITKKQKGNGFVVIFKEKYRNLEESIKKSMFKKISLKESRMKRKFLKESDKYWEAYEQAKKIIIDANVPEIYVDNVYEHKKFFMFYLEGEVTEKNVNKIIEQFNKNKEKYNLISKVREPVRDGGTISFFIKEEAFLKDLEESKKLSRFNKRISENSKRKSFKEYKKLKESKFRKNSRKLNESDSVSIEIDFGNYQECLRCIFKVEGENLGTDQLDWYTEVGMEMGIDPNSMYVWVKNDAELLSLEEVREYNDLGDASDEEVVDFANERGYYEGEINGDIYFLVPLGM